MERKLGELLDLISESITVYDRDARLLYLNQAAVRPFRRPREELLGHAPWDLFPAAPRSAFRDALERCLTTRLAESLETHIAAIDRWYQIDLYPFSVDGALVVSRDVTDNRRAATKLRESEERFRLLIEHAPEAILIFDVERARFVEANVAAEKLFGRARDVILAMSPRELSAPTQADGSASEAFLAHWIRKAVEDGVGELEWRYIGPRGQVGDAEVRLRRLPSSDSVLLRASIQDISARKQAQARLADVQRLEAVARLAGGVAHDFNNMLTIILAGSQLALRELPEPHPARDDLLNVINATERAALVTRQLLAFGRRQDASPRRIDLTAYIEKMQPVLARIVGEDVELELELARPLGAALVDPAHVEQILLNLAANARDAMPRGGTITIHTANVFLDGEYQRLHNGVPPGRYVLLTVADTGEGIPEAIKPHIFEPFFTTKSLDRGTGLGLATVHGIVQQNRGHIWVYSEPQMGTTFKVYFPLVGDSIPVEADAETARATTSGSETILLVEDEDRVRQVVRRALQRAGYTVLEARNAGEAILIFEQHDEPIALMLSDVVMPHMTGPRLAERLRKLRPSLPVIFLSGYSEERVVPSDDATKRDSFIAKPIDLDALLRCVREVLDRTSLPE